MSWENKPRYQLRVSTKQQPLQTLPIPTHSCRGPEVSSHSLGLPATTPGNSVGLSDSHCSEISIQPQKVFTDLWSSKERWLGLTLSWWRNLSGGSHQITAHESDPHPQGKQNRQMGRSCRLFLTLCILSQVHILCYVVGTHLPVHGNAKGCF